jgi:hypothetical protein
MRLRPQDEPADADPTGRLHRPVEQHVRLGRLERLGDRVVGLLEEHRVDVGEVDEVLDVDRPAALRPRAVDLFAREQHDVARVGLHAANDVLPADLPAARRLAPLLGHLANGSSRRLRLGIPALNRLRLGGFLALRRRFPRRLFVHDPFVPNAPSRPVIQMESNVLRLGRRHQPYRHVHQPEAETPGPHGVRHEPKPTLEPSEPVVELGRVPTRR